MSKAIPRPLRRPMALGLIGLVGLAACAPTAGPRLIPLKPANPPDRPALSLRRAERAARLEEIRQGLLVRARAQGRWMTDSPLGERILRLSAPLLEAAREVRPERADSAGPIDVILMDTNGVADVLPMAPAGVILVLPVQASAPDLGDPLLSALLAHGIAHGLRDHALETEWLDAAGPRFTPIQEREADRDTCELLARAGLDPMLAWDLRARLAQGSRPTPPTDWGRRHPDPPGARQSIEAFAARVKPLRANTPAVR
ncbi:MAG: hypothetical protein ACO26U_09180 [Burkholderiaceae bacterium]